MIEVWKDIENYEGLYQVSNLGRVKALKKQWLTHHTAILTHEEQIIKPHLNHNGYLRVILTKDKNYKHFPVHRLVANAFIGKQPNKEYVINHKDFNRQNNCATNLEWLTQKENASYSKEHHRAGVLKRLKPKSNYHYIYERKMKTHNVWTIYVKKSHFYKQFNTLDEAIKYRDENIKTILSGGIK